MHVFEAVGGNRSTSREPTCRAAPNNHNPLVIFTSVSMSVLYSTLFEVLYVLQVFVHYFNPSNKNEYIK